MLRLLRTFLRRAPLCAGILLVWLLLTAVSIAGRAGGAYQGYSTGHGKLPGLSIVMRGIHDHVAPWSTPDQKSSDSKSSDSKSFDSKKSGAKESGAEESDAEGSDTKESDAKNSGPEVSDAKDSSVKGGDGKSSGTSDEKESSAEKQDSSSKDSAKEDGKSSDPSKETDSDPAKEKSSDSSKETDKEQPQSGKEEQTKDTADKEKESGNTDKKESAADKENREKNTEKDESAGDTKTAEQSGGSGSVVLTIPENSGSKVVPAKDYGVADQMYLSPDDTVYNTDTEGLFAPNGTYYALQQVDDSYFSDALFVGDSRTVGLYEYGNMSSFTSFLARESTTVYALLNENEKMEYNPKGKKTQERSLTDLLSKAKFKKIYLSVGVNELGIPDTEDYYKEYRKVIRRIHKLQPDAIIYIQGIMHVSKNRSSKDRVFNNRAIVQRNQAISTLANGRNIFYIDMNAEVCDKDGNLMDDLTGDGIHLKASACDIWHTFLKNNAVVITKVKNKE